MNNLCYHLKDFLFSLGIEGGNLPAVTTAVMALGAVIVAAIIFKIIYTPVAGLVRKVVVRTPTPWDNRLLSKGMMKHVAWLAALGWLLLCNRHVFALYPGWQPTVAKIGNVALIVSLFLFFNKTVTTVYRGMRQDSVDVAGLSVLRNLLVAIVGAVGALLIISVLTSRNITYILSGLGAMAAVLSLVFKDSILGMTAGIRLVSNKMIKHNDWINVPAFNANGRVMDVRLTAVKVRNWDNSISSIPPHALITNGFQNMEQMLNQGTRRIERRILVDLHSVRAFEPEECSAFAGEEWASGIDLRKPQPNLLLWRRWLKDYISRHPMTEPRPRLMVRELAAGAEGIPVEVHFFVRCLVWEEFEELQADITDEVLLSMQRFGLRPFQYHSAPEKSRAAKTVETTA